MASCRKFDFKLHFLCMSENGDGGRRWWVWIRCRTNGKSKERMNIVHSLNSTQHVISIVSFFGVKFSTSFFSRESMVFNNDDAYMRTYTPIFMFHRRQLMSFLAEHLRYSYFLVFRAWLLYFTYIFISVTENKQD